MTVNEFLTRDEHEKKIGGRTQKVFRRLQSCEFPAGPSYWKGVRHGAEMVLAILTPDLEMPLGEEAEMVRRQVFDKLSAGEGLTTCVQCKATIPKLGRNKLPDGSYSCLLCSEHEPASSS